MIEPLPLAFRSKERIYRQLARKGIVALYEVRNFRHSLIGFELIIIRYQKAKLRDTWKYPERERYPQDEEFGSYGWSIPVASLALAELAFDHLSTRMARNRSELPGNKDYYSGWGSGKASWEFRTLLYSWATGRRLAKSPQRTNMTKAATETMGNN